MYEHTMIKEILACNFSGFKDIMYDARTDRHVIVWSYFGQVHLYTAVRTTDCFKIVSDHEKELKVYNNNLWG